MARLKQFGGLLKTKAQVIFFQTYDWIDHWYRTIGKTILSVTPFIVTVYYETRVVALLPFGLRPVKGLRVFEWLGGDQTDYMTGLFSFERNWTKEEIHAIWGPN